ncbi:class I SAM-dependent methyltransferase [Anaerosporobacter faecicola]|uniref:class I SAM-dependent methyltransferase n=1 Tax=Anaerosporobacter faecicola TaxID=2718714 RepID=UPI00143A8FBA|nr:class I SAM-dependent methyltransferase [Anaerosporobacter faecicola]
MELNQKISDINTWLDPVNAKKSEDPRTLREITECTLDYYNKRAQEFVDGTVDVHFTEVQELFLSYLSNGNKILDLGCGSGRDTKYFLEKGYQVDAIDGSAELCKLATEYTGIPVKHMVFEELNEKEQYEGVWACASILHVPRRSLPNILSKITDATKKDGIVYISFKYGNVEGIKNGRYFTYLTEETLIELLEQGQTKNYKLAVEKQWVSGDVRVNRGEERWLNVILRKKEIR